MRTPSNIKMQKTGAKVVFYAGGDGPLLILALAEYPSIETEPGSGGSAMNFTFECEQEVDGRWIAEAPELVPIC